MRGRFRRGGARSFGRKRRSFSRRGGRGRGASRLRVGFRM